MLVKFFTKLLAGISILLVGFIAPLAGAATAVDKVNKLVPLYFDWRDKLIHYAAATTKPQVVFNKTGDGRLLKLTKYNERIVSTMSPDIPILMRNIEASFKVNYRIYGKNARRSYNTVDAGYRVTCAFNFDPKFLSNVLFGSLMGLPLAAFDSLVGSLGSGSSVASASAGTFNSLNGAVGNLNATIREMLTPAGGVDGTRVSGNGGKEPGFEYTLTPGKTLYISLIKNNTLGSFGSASIKAAKIKIENCLGPVTVKSYAKLTSSSDQSSDFVEIEGKPVEIWV